MPKIRPSRSNSKFLKAHKLLKLTQDDGISEQTYNNLKDWIGVLKILQGNYDFIGEFY